MTFERITQLQKIMTLNPKFFTSTFPSNFDLMYELCEIAAVDYALEAKTVLR